MDVVCLRNTSIDTLHKGDDDDDDDDDNNNNNKHQGTAENSHTWHCTLTRESTNIKVQNIQNGK